MVGFNAFTVDNTVSTSRLNSLNRVLSSNTMDPPEYIVNACNIYPNTLSIVSSSMLLVTFTTIYVYIFKHTNCKAVHHPIF